MGAPINIVGASAIQRDDKLVERRYLDGSLNEAWRLSITRKREAIQLSSNNRFD